MKTSSYNHNALGTAQKPLIPNLIFKETMEGLRQRNDVEFYELVREEYSFETFQKIFAEGEYQEALKRIAINQTQLNGKVVP